MQLLSQFLKEKITDKVVIDLGCAGFGEDYGNQAKMLIRYSKEWFGGDINEKFLRKNSDNKNLFYCDLNKLDFFDKLPKKADLICLIEVVEHLHSPFSTIKYICENKKRTTELLVSVPNGMSLGRVIYGLFNKDRLLEQDPHHYYVFNQRTSDNLFKDAGLSEYEIIPYTRTPTMRAILKFIPMFASGFLIYGR